MNNKGRYSDYRRLIVPLLLSMFCFSPRQDFIYLHKKVELPYVYYRFKGGASAVPAYAPWDVPEEEAKWQKEKMYLFVSDDNLQKSYDLISSGKAGEASSYLKEKLEQLKDPKSKALYLNNLSISLLVNSEYKKAKSEINQAGILYPENHTILANARLITTFFQKNIKVVKYKEEMAKPDEKPVD